MADLGIPCLVIEWVGHNTVFFVNGSPIPKWEELNNLMQNSFTKVEVLTYKLLV